MIAILIHGFNVRDGGRATVGKLRPFFARRQIPYVMVNYGWFGIGRTYIKNRKIAGQVALACEAAQRVGEKVAVVGHSNGCAIAHCAAERFGAQIDKLVYINPALEKDTPLPESVNSLDVWHSPGDHAVKLSKWLPQHPWGEMGATGYQGPEDQRIVNYNKQDDPRYSYICSSGHSDVFDVDKLPFFGPIIVSRAESFKKVS